MGAGSSSYQIHVTGILDDSKIRAQLAAIEAQINKGGLAAVTGSGKGAKKGQTVYAQAGKDAQKAAKQTTAFAGATKKASLNLLDVGKKVVAFGAVTSAIQLATSGMTDMLAQVKTVDDQLTELKKVSDLSAEGLKNYTKQAGEAGKATGRTTAEMLDAAT